jgi:hypothetical protein
MLFYWWSSPLNLLPSLVNTSDVDHFNDSLLTMHSTLNVKRLEGQTYQRFLGESKPYVMRKGETYFCHFCHKWVVFLTSVIWLCNRIFMVRYTFSIMLRSGDWEDHVIHLILFSCFHRFVSYSSVGKWRAITGHKICV